MAHQSICRLFFEPEDMGAHFFRDRLNQLVDDTLGTFGIKFHPPIKQIPDITVNGKTCCDSAGFVSKTNTLNVA